MADNHTKAVRSKNMSHIRSKDTRPEEIVRKYLFAKGFRYRKNVKALPGCPDIVLPKYHTVIFVMDAFGTSMIVHGSYGQHLMKNTGVKKFLETSKGIKKFIRC